MKPSVVILHWVVICGAAFGFSSTALADEPQHILDPRVIIGFEPKHADEGWLKWKRAQAADVMKWKQYETAKAVDLRAMLPPSKAADWPGKEARRRELEKSIGRLVGGIKTSKEMVPTQYPPFAKPELKGLAHWRVDGNAGSADIAVSETGRLYIRVRMEQPARNQDDFFREARALVKDLWGADPGEPIDIGRENSRLRHLEWRNDNGKANVMASRLELYYGAGDSPRTTRLELRCGTGPQEWKELTADELATLHGHPTEREALAIATLVLEDTARRNESLEAARKAGVSLVTGELKARRATYYVYVMPLAYWRVTFATDDDWESGRAVEMSISSANQIGHYTSPNYITGTQEGFFAPAESVEPSNLSVPLKDIQMWPEYAETVQYVEQRRADRSALIAKHKEAIVRHLQSLRGRVIPDLSSDSEFHIDEDDGGKKHVMAKFDSVWARYRLVDDKPELDSIGLYRNQRLEQTLLPPGEWPRFARKSFDATLGDHGPADFRCDDRGWMDWIPTWRSLPLPQRFCGHASLRRSDGPGAKFIDSPLIWNAKGAVATELKRARAGLEGYELRGNSRDLIARAVKCASATNEHLDLSRTEIVSAEYRLVDLQELKRSHGSRRNFIDLQAIEALERRGPVAPLYCVKLTCSPPWPHLIELCMHSESGELVCQIDNMQKFN